MGLIFEMPILVFFLSLMGIVSPGFMWKNFRYSILVIFIVAAIVTPTPDIVNMCIFAAPMIALYAISIGVAWLVHPKQREARKSKAGAGMSGQRSQSGTRTYLWVALVGLLLVGLACNPSKDAAQEKDKSQSAPAISAADTALPTLSFPPESGPPPTFDANRAMQYVKEIVAFGPRPIGSANHKKVEDYITSHLKGDTGRGRRIHRGYTRRQVPGAQHHRKISGNKRWDCRYREPLRHELPTAEYFIHRGERRRRDERSFVGIRATNFAARSATAIACGYCGPTPKRRSKHGPTLTVSMAPVISHRNGSRTEPPSRSRRFCWPI